MHDDFSATTGGVRTHRTAPQRHASGVPPWFSVHVIREAKVVPMFPCMLHQAQRRCGFRAASLA